MTTVEVSQDRCLLCFEHQAKLFRCGSCRVAVYCCKEHQVCDWPRHKQNCAQRNVTKQARVEKQDFIKSFENSPLFPLLVAIKDYVMRHNVDDGYNAFHMTLQQASPPMYLVVPIYLARVGPRSLDTLHLQIDGDMICTLKHSQLADLAHRDFTLHTFFGKIENMARFFIRDPIDNMAIAATQDRVTFVKVPV